MATFQFPLSTELVQGLNYSPWGVISFTPDTPLGIVGDSYEIFLRSVARDDGPPSRNTIEIALCFEVVLNCRTRVLFVDTLDPYVRHNQWINALMTIFPRHFGELGLQNVGSDASSVGRPAQTLRSTLSDTIANLEEENLQLRAVAIEQHQRILMHFYSMSLSHMSLTAARTEIEGLRRKEQQLKRVKAALERLKMANLKLKMRRQSKRDTNH